MLFQSLQLVPMAGGSSNPPASRSSKTFTSGSSSTPASGSNVPVARYSGLTLEQWEADVNRDRPERPFHPWTQEEVSPRPCDLLQTSG